MNRERFERVAEIFERVREAAPADRGDLLRESCGGDADLRREVEALLKHHDEPSSGGSSLGGAIGRAAAEIVEDSRAAQSAVAGKRLGSFELIRLLGQGGMGTVYEARQHKPDRTVALKLIRSDLVSVSARRRFEREVALLGQLQHEGIARIYEAGTLDDDGVPRPYFAMEYVEGRPLNEYARRRELTLSEKLSLFRRVCEAVGFAHHRGVIHRDLKPSNVLVGEPGDPKVLDFGVGRALDDDATLMSLQTDTGQVLGTLPYMSPEQVAGDVSRVDTRSDVYSLGVMLYELLSGSRPFDVGRRSLVEAARVIQTEEPSTLGNLDRSLRGDVETIVGRSLEKDPLRRYENAAELAAEIGRFLAHEPILARPPSASYQLRKFARRHRALVTGAALVFLSLTAGLIGTTTAMLRAQEAERAAQEATVLAEERRIEAERQTKIAEAVNEFLNRDILAVGDPLENQSPDLSVRDALQLASEKIEAQFEDEPLVAAAVHQTIGQTYRNIGDLERAEPHLLRAIDIRKRELGDEHRETLVALNHLAILYDFRGQYDKSIPIFRRSAEVRTRELGRAHDDTLSTLNNLGVALLDTGELDESEKILLEVAAAREKKLGPNDPETLSSLNNLASLYFQQERFREAIPIAERVLEARRRVLGEDHPRTLRAMDNLATNYLSMGRVDEAETLVVDLRERAMAFLEPTHQIITTSTNSLAMIYFRQGKFEKSLDMFRDSANHVRKKLGQDHWSAAIALSNAGGVLLQMKRFEEAEAELLESFRMLESRHGLDDARTQSTVGLLVRLYREWDRPVKLGEWQAKDHRTRP